MAARKRALRIDDRWREKIRTSMLINRLQGHVEGKIDMGASQVTAALGLLKKVAPDMTSATLTGEDGGPAEIIFRTVYEKRPGD